MGKLLLLVSSLMFSCFSLWVNAGTLNELQQRYFDSEKYSINVVKSENTQLKSEINKVLNSSSFAKIEQEDFDTKETSVYLSSDGNTLYIFSTEANPVYPNYITAIVSNYDGSLNTEFSLHTNLTNEVISFNGSNNNEFRMTIVPTKFISLVSEICGEHNGKLDNIDKLRVTMQKLLGRKNLKHVEKHIIRKIV